MLRFRLLPSTLFAALFASGVAASSLRKQETPMRMPALPASFVMRQHQYGCVPSPSCSEQHYLAFNGTFLSDQASNSTQMFGHFASLRPGANRFYYELLHAGLPLRNGTGAVFLLTGKYVNGSDNNCSVQSAPTGSWYSPPTPAVNALGMPLDAEYTGRETFNGESCLRFQYTQTGSEFKVLYSPVTLLITRWQLIGPVPSPTIAAWDNHIKMYATKFPDGLRVHAAGAKCPPRTGTNADAKGLGLPSLLDLLRTSIRTSVE